MTGLTVSQGRLSRTVLIITAAALICFSVFLQLLYPAYLLEGDEYYHIAMAREMKASGIVRDFKWAKFSLFEGHYADKDFLFHLSIVPFLFFFKDAVAAAKFAIIFYSIAFILLLAFILRRYLPGYIAAVLLLLLFFNYFFLSYFIRLRPVLLANILTILGIFFLIKKRWPAVFIISFLFSWSHISFFTIIIFAACAELVRLFIGSGEKKEFFLKNILAAAGGVLLGCLLHPNNPNNWVSLHLNGFLVPFYNLSGKKLDFGIEMLPASSNVALLYNIAAFLILYSGMWFVALGRIRLSYAACVWWLCASIYVFFSFFSARFWFSADILIIVAFAALIGDWLKDKPAGVILRKARWLCAGSLIAVSLFLPLNLKMFRETLLGAWQVNRHYVDTGNWMAENIPPGETVFHSSWMDSPWFICLNPKDSYLVVLDPIYMYYPDPGLYSIYALLSRGHYPHPGRIIRQAFGGINYGYAGKNYKLAQQVKKDKDNFLVLYEDDMGIVFKLLTPEENDEVKQSA